MPLHDFRTVWGPPGTGKTQVLNAIIAMAISGGLKIQVCAPSNAAIDEILTRINAKGLIGLQIKRDIKRKVNSSLTDQNLQAEEFKFEGKVQNPEEVEIVDDEIQKLGSLQDIIIRLGSIEYTAPEHLKEYSMNEKCQQILSKM